MRPRSFASARLARGFAVVTSLSIFLAVSAHAVTISVTTCGQTVSGRASLTGDLDCTGLPDPGVRLTSNSTLDLAGFTLSGGDGDGVECEGVCKIISSEPGGTIADFLGHGVVSQGSVKGAGRIRVGKSIVRDNGGHGVFVNEAEGNITVSLSDIRTNGGAGIITPDRMRVGRSVVSGNALEGAYGDTLKVNKSLFELNGTGIEALTYLGIIDSEVNDNVGDGIHIGSNCRTRRVNVLRNGGTGIVFDTILGDALVFFIEVSDNGLDGIRVENPQTDRLRLKISFVRRNGRHGIVSERVRLNQSRVDENAFHGVYAPAGTQCNVRIDRYTLVDNGTDASCGVTTTCADIASCLLPVNLSASTECDTSYDSSSGFPGVSWSICTED